MLFALSARSWVRTGRACLAVSAVLLTIGSTTAGAADKPTVKKDGPKLNYEEHVLPIFRQKCNGCHNLDKKSGGLDLTNYSSMMQGGSSGDVIDPGSASASYLFSLVSHSSQPFMPPNSEKIPADMLATISKWIDDGALEKSGSKAAMSKKPKVDLTLKVTSTGKPEGPPPMPGKLPAEPILRTKQTTAVSALATSPWASLAAVAGQKQVFLYDTRNLRLLGVLPFPEGVPQVLKFSRSGTLLLAGGGRGAYRGKVVVWNVKTGERVAEVGDEVDSVLAADISADQSMIALGGPSKVVRIYSTSEGKLLHEIRKHTDWIYSMEFSPDGVLLATGDRNGGVFVWEAATGREYLSIRGHTKGVTSISWRGDSNILATGSEDTTIRQWELENGNQVRSWGAHGGNGVASIEYTRDGRIASCGHDRVAKIWNDNGTVIRQFETLPDSALQVTHCDETNRVICGDWTGAIRVWEAADGKAAGTLSSNPLPLQSRIEAANAALPARQAEAQKQATVAQAAAQALAKGQADLTAAQQLVAQGPAKIQQANAALQQAKNAEAQQVAGQQAAVKAAADADVVLKRLQQEFAAADAAAKKTPADKKLADAAVAKKAELDKQVVAVAATTKAVADTTPAVTAAKAQTVAADAAVKTLMAQIDAATKSVPGLTAAIKPLTDAVTAANAASELAKKELATVQEEISFCTDGVGFAKRYQAYLELQAKQDELSGAAQAAKGEAARLRSEVTVAQQVVTDAPKQTAAAQAAIAAAKGEVAKQEAAVVAATKAVVEAEAQLAKLVGKPKPEIDKQTAVVATAKKSLADAQAAVAKAKEQVTAGEKQLAAIPPAVAAASKKIAELTPQIKPAEDKAAAAKIAAETSTKELDKTRAAIQAEQNGAATSQRASASK